MKTIGLDRLEALQKQGDLLFQADRTPGPVSVVYPATQTTSLDPCRVRGVWVPKVGLLRPVPLVRHAFGNALAAAAAAIAQDPELGLTMHADEFANGTVALTFGEKRAGRGYLAKLLSRTSALLDEMALAHCFVNVLAKADFPENRLSFAFPGQSFSLHPVPVFERVALTVGDLRSLTSMFSSGLPVLGDTELARADPFTGSFAEGGHLQFDAASGERDGHRRPTLLDRKVALALIEERGRRWLELSVGMGRTEPGNPAAGLLMRTAQDEPVSHRTGYQPAAFRRAVAFIEANCTRMLTIADLAQVTRLSRTGLHQVFQKMAGCTPLAYAAERRLDAAERFLRDSDLTISEVSARCGFAEPASLCRSLKNRRGVSPSSFRRLSQLSPTQWEQKDSGSLGQV